MTSNFPAKHRRNWLIWTLAYGTLITLLFWLNRFVVVGQDFQPEFALRFLLLAFVLAGLVNAFGWLGARWIWLLTTAGLLLGLALMFFYSTRNGSGWEDLASLLGFFEGVVIGFILGVLVEAIQWVTKRRGKKNQ